MAKVTLILKSTNQLLLSRKIINIETCCMVIFTGVKFHESWFWLFMSSNVVQRSMFLGHRYHTGTFSELFRKVKNVKNYPHMNFVLSYQFIAVSHIDCVYFVVRVTLECHVACDTEPEVAWFKDNLPLNSPDYETRFDNGVATLTIEETFSEDTARYTAQFITPQGTVETSAHLTVRGRFGWKKVLEKPIGLKT